MYKATVLQRLNAVIILMAVSLPAAGAATLIGGVTVNDELPKTEVTLKKMSGEKSDKVAAEPKRDCICFDRQRVQAREVNGSWKIVDADHWILDFNTSSANAQLALETIQRYKMNQICFVGRDAGTPMMYFLSDGKAPEGDIGKGEDSLPLDPTKVKAEQINGRWKLTCGDEWMEDFASSEASARDAAEQIRTLGFTRQCFIGRPGASMRYFVK